MPDKMKVYVVEDEPLARDELNYILLRSGQVELAGESESMDKALEEIRRLHPDVVFVDIHLSQGNGLDLVRELNRLPRPPVIVFATAYDEHALKAFELNAFDYILKPFDEDRVRQTLERAAKRLPMASMEPFRVQSPAFHPPQEHLGKLAVTSGERILLLDLDRVVYVSAEDGQVTVKTADAEYRMAATLSEMERKLGTYPFFRAHRSYIVNLNQVTEIEPWFNGTYNLLFKDGSKVPVSRTYIKDLRQALGF